MFVEMDDENATFTTAYISTEDSIYTVNMQNDTEWIAWCPDCHQFEQISEVVLSEKEDIQFSGKCMRCGKYMNLSHIQPLDTLDEVYRTHFDFTIKER